MSKLYVGIDVSSRNNVVYLMKPDGSKHSNFSVENSPKGSAELVKQIVKALTSYNLTEVTVGLESTGCYGDHLVYFLKENAELAKFNRSIHVLNPKQVKKFKDTYNDLQKNDYIDSFVIADCLRFGRINKEVYMDDARFKALQILTRQRFFTVQSLTAEKQRFLNVIFKKYSSLAQNKVFSDTFGASALALYEEFDSADTLAYMDLHELTDFLVKKSKNRFSDPEAVAKAIQKAARSSYRLPKTVNDSVNQVLSSSICLIRALEQQIKVLDKAIAEQMRLLPNKCSLYPTPCSRFRASVLFIRLVLSQRSVTYTVLKINPHSANTPDLHGLKISPVTLKANIQSSFAQETNSSNTTFVKPHFLLYDAILSTAASTTSNTTR